MKSKCAACGGQLQVKYKLSPRNLVIFLLYLLALFFSFVFILRFSGWYGAIIVTAIAIVLGLVLRNFYQRYTQCRQCNEISTLD